MVFILGTRRRYLRGAQGGGRESPCYSMRTDSTSTCSKGASTSSRYSNGTGACFTVRGHERYQPAMALVVSVLAAWWEGRVDEVREGISPP